jgi:tetratricopeptide (TPR) repeat protein
MDNRILEYQLFNEKLKNCVERNNLGIAYEQQGNIDQAIEIYEANIREGYPASHSFDRLMIIYRKQKRFIDEIRVLQRTIEVFQNNKPRGDISGYLERLNARLDKSLILFSKQDYGNG